MQRHLRGFIEICKNTLPLIEPVYEHGALQVSNNAEVEDLRTLFPSSNYVGCDMRPGPGVDRVLNLHDLDLSDASVGTAICMDTMEHVEYPRQAMSEIHRTLVPGGALIISSVMNFPIHGYPNDYWRFTPEGFRSLLKDFESLFVGFTGAQDFPQSIVAIAFKEAQPDMSKFEIEYKRWQHKCNTIIEKLKTQ